MQDKNTKTPSVGTAVVLTNSIPSSTTTKWLIKAINVQDNSILELWSDTKQDYDAGSQVGFIAEWKNVASRNDPRKTEDRQFFDIIPAEGVIALQALQANA